MTVKHIEYSSSNEQGNGSSKVDNTRKRCALPNSSSYDSHGFASSGQQGSEHAPSANYFDGALRSWGNSENSPSSTTQDAEGNNQIQGTEMLVSRIDENLQGIRNIIQGDEPSLGVNLQVQPRIFIPRVSKKIAENESLLADLNRPLASQMNNNLHVRRGSNDSGAESYTSSRRCSDISLQSYLSSRRSSFASPLSSRLSPRNINNAAHQTLVEGQIMKSVQLDQMTPCHDHELSSSVSDFNNISYTRQSRVSSGYSSQNNYFSCKSPSLNMRNSPVPPSAPRRASEGNVRRVSDTAFDAMAAFHKNRNLRRCSEPVVNHAHDTTQIIDNVPRRHSLSTYKVLPTPPAMLQSLPTENDTNDEILQDVKDIDSSSKSQSDIPSAAGYLQMISNRSMQQNQQFQFQEQQRSNQQQHLQHLPKPPHYPKYPVHNTISSNNPNSLVQNQRMDFMNFQLPPSEEEVASGVEFPMSSSSGQTFIQADSTTPDKLLTNCSEQCSTNIRIQNQDMDPLVSFVEDLGMHQAYHSSEIDHNNRPSTPSVNARYNHEQFWLPTALSKENSHNRHSQGALHTHYGINTFEADSTEDIKQEKKLDNFISESFGTLTTEPMIDEPLPNMVLNDMNTLLFSFAEENKYFENQGFL